MRLLKWCYCALAVVATTVLAISFFMQGIDPIVKITLLTQSVGFMWAFGVAIGADT